VLTRNPPHGPAAGGRAHTKLDNDIATRCEKSDPSELIR
jgi:hypothetical protein